MVIDGVFYWGCRLQRLDEVISLYYLAQQFRAFLLLHWQFGNTCYCNSVLQALYFCRPFRENVLAYKAQQKKKENLLTCLADLFHSIATQKKKVGVIPPKKFISRLRKENGECKFWFLSETHVMSRKVKTLDNVVKLISQIRFVISF